MSLSKNQVQYIEEAIRKCLRDKFLNYKPESSNMPFHYRLLGKDRLALYSFIQSLNTSFGTSIFEPVAVALAETNFTSAKRQYTAGNKISASAYKVIQEIMDDLTIGKSISNKPNEIKRIRKVAQKGKMQEVKPTKVDIL